MHFWSRNYTDSFLFYFYSAILMNYTAPGERLIYTTIVFFTPSSRKLLSGLNHLHSHANQYRECTYFITLAPDLISHTGVAHCYDKYQAPPPGSQFRWHHRNHFSPWHCRNKFPLLISTNQIREKPAVIMTLSGVSFYSRGFHRSFLCTWILLFQPLKRTVRSKPALDEWQGERAEGGTGAG